MSLSSPQKRNLDQNINDSKSHIFENIVFGIQCFYIRPYISVDIIRVFL